MNNIRDIQTYTHTFEIKAYELTEENIPYLKEEDFNENCIFDDKDKSRESVQPGDYVIIPKEGKFFILKKELFKSLYTIKKNTEDKE